MSPFLAPKSNLLWPFAVKAFRFDLLFERNKRIFHFKLLPRIDCFASVRLKAFSWCSLSKSFVDLLLQVLCLTGVPLSFCCSSTCLLLSFIVLDFALFRTSYLLSICFFSFYQWKVSFLVKKKKKKLYLQSKKFEVCEEQSTKPPEYLPIASEHLPSQ